MTLLLARLLDYLEARLGIRRRHSHFYRAYLRSDTWKRVRTGAISAARNRCQECGYSGRRLQVHHLNYANLGRERPQDLRVLCPNCHVAADRKRQGL